MTSSRSCSRSPARSRSSPYLVQGDSTNLKVAIAIFAVVLLNAVIGFVQEYRAERTAEALKRLLPARARVLRDGTPTEVAAEELVPGDVVLLRRGRRGLRRLPAARGRSSWRRATRR